ncbi:MAG TPA: methyltransferase domain-containing protein [Bryobacteraceae bacterium]|nr:methyltransferase domain-containing protein [Bryobacteraceae bacterium]
MSEFTGERVIPGEVNDDLWAEHIARYAFASRLASQARVLDIGCGTGYGTVELAQHARSATGIDVSEEALVYAREHYSIPNATFLHASATALPFPAASFDLITAFEVIEHLGNWHDLLIETRRLLHPDGTFLVSTPNKLYYAESRADQGPNPFHTHEFEFAEFRDALAAVFPHVSILLQNRLESQAFYPHAIFAPVDAQLDTSRGSPEQAHFFLALCSVDCVPETRSFIYVPRAANLLREREQHIFLLQQELAKTNEWLDGVISDRQKLIEAQHELEAHLEEHNRWALQLDRDYKTALERVSELQSLMQAEQTKAIEMAAAYQRTVDALEEENRRKTEWAIDTEKRLSAALAQKCEELAETVQLLDRAEATVVERTGWAQELDRNLQQANAKLQTLSQSSWVKIGRAAGVAPKIGGDH